MPRLAVDRKSAMLWGTIAKYQVASNMSDGELAKRMGVTYGTLANYRAGRTDMPLRTMQSIVRALNIPVDEIARYAL